MLGALAGSLWAQTPCTVGNGCPLPDPVQNTVNTTLSVPTATNNPGDPGNTLILCNGQDGVYVPFTSACLAGALNNGTNWQNKINSDLGLNADVTEQLTAGAVYLGPLNSSCIPGYDSTQACHIYINYAPAWDNTHKFYITSTAVSSISPPGTRIQPFREQAISYSVSSNQVTISRKHTFLPGFSVGEVIYFSGFTSATWLNGQHATVTSDNGDQLIFAFTQANASITSDSGLIESSDTHFMAKVISTDGNPAILQNGNIAGVVYYGLEIYSASTVGCTAGMQAVYAYCTGETLSLLRGVGPDETGYRPVTVTTGSTTGTMYRAFQLLDPNTAYFSMSPDTLAVGSTSVTFTGIGTNWNGSSVLDCQGSHYTIPATTPPVTGTLSVSGLTAATATLTVASGASGAITCAIRTVTNAGLHETSFQIDRLVYGSHVVTMQDGSGNQNFPVGTTSATITGDGTTNFTSGSMVFASNPGGVTFGAQTGVTSNTITLPVTVSASALPVPRRIRVITGTFTTGENDWSQDWSFSTVPAGCVVLSVTPAFGLIGGGATHVVVKTAGCALTSGTVLSLCGNASQCTAWGYQGVVVSGWTVSGSGCSGAPTGTCGEADVTPAATAEEGVSFQIHSSWIHGHDGDCTDASTNSPCTTATTLAVLNNTKEVREGVVFDGRKLAFVDSVVNEIHDKTADSQGLECFYCKTTNVTNNGLTAASESIMFGGAVGSYGGPIAPTDATLTQNYYFKPLLYNIPGVFQNIVFGSNPTYAPGTTYSVGNVVSYTIPGSSTSNYWSIVNGNLGNTPSSSPSFWRLTTAPVLEKDAQEFKSMNRAEVYGNVIQNLPRGPQPYGYAFVLTPRTGENQGNTATLDDNINIHDNAEFNVNGGANTLGSDNNCGNAVDYTCTWQGEFHWDRLYDTLILLNSTATQGAYHPQGFSINGGNPEQNLGIEDFIDQHNTTEMVYPDTETCFNYSYVNLSGLTGAPPAFSQTTYDWWSLDNVKCNQPTGDWGQQGYIGWEAYGGNPSGNTATRLQGNVMYSPGTVYAWLTSNSCATNTLPTFASPSTGNYQLVGTPFGSGPCLTETSDEQLPGVFMDILTPLILAAENGGSNGPLTIQTTSLPNGTVGINYNQAIVASGGVGGYTWTIPLTGSLPPGLATTSPGVITGTPTATGTFNFTVKVCDTVPTCVTAPLSITIAAGALSITTISIPSGTVGTAYSAAITAANGIPPYTWAVIFCAGPCVGGNIPGLTLAASGTPTTHYAGTPAASGIYTVSIKVTDSALNTAIKPFPAVFINHAGGGGHKLVNVRVNGSTRIK